MATAVRTTDHDEIREWVESKGGRPAIVKGTSGMLRIDFGEPDETLEPVDWDTFFQIFDESGVDFLYDPKGHMVKFVPHGSDDRGDAEEDRKMPRRRTASSRTGGRKKSTSARKSSAGRKKSTDGRKKSTDGRKKSTGGRKKATGGRKKATGGRKKATGGRKKSTSSRKTTSRKSTARKTSSRKSTSGRKKSTSGNGRKKKSTGGRKYSKKAQRKVGRVMHEYKEGGLKSGRSGRKVKNRKQAIAIGISEARREGDKVPSRRGGKKSSGRKKRS
jgi:hypothetical protein